MRSLGRCVICTLFLLTVSGCATGPFPLAGDETNCGPEAGSADWWSQQAMLPPGVRQKCYKGKMWPVQPRPTVPRQQFTHTYHSAHYWPLPYVCQERDYVRNIVQTQMTNGWQQETTLYGRHFGDDQVLNVPGKLHLIDILEVTPSQYRTIYVQSSYHPEIDSSRVSSVEQVVMELTGGTEHIPIVLRKGRDYSRPASEVKVINDLYNSSVPTPRLGGSAGGGGGGASASGAAPSATGP
ncbi:MAG: hypothetical protein RIK87_07290 [Fuerstiella sp.]